MPVDSAREARFTWAGIAVTVAASVAFMVTAAEANWHLLIRGQLVAAAGAALLALVVVFLVYGNLIYQTARLGYLWRHRRHRPATRAELDELYLGPDISLTILVPSYREQPEVIRQTLLSAALQEFPDKRLVLLIDDPPTPGDEASRRLLNAARGLAGEIECLLAPQAVRARDDLLAFEKRLSAAMAGKIELADIAVKERPRLILAHLAAATWFYDLADKELICDHTDALFVEQVLRAAGDEHHRAATELITSAESDLLNLWLGYRRILARFDAEVTCFERKRYVNLSHEPNKAMNLNSYIGLLGRSWNDRPEQDGIHLCTADEDDADLVVPAASYVATVDADSVLLPGYCMRLVHLCERPGNERIAVAQTPYSAVPGAASPIERVAGATTDMQYIVHQGFTRHHATFWVGANAIIRYDALVELRSDCEERGFIVGRYIQDRTVIEDTESSVDLISNGWRLINYPERLSFSATPSDFGSLVVQRRRWANGGLIILPKLLRYLGQVPTRLAHVGGWMRLHYLVSITGSNVGLLLLLSIPFATPKGALFIPIAAAPYFLLYARDLRQAGYRYRDVVEVYALNLLLVPVNLAGVAKSIQQSVTKTKIPFGRTPKVHGRTRTPRRYLLAALVMLVYWAYDAAWDGLAHHWVHLGYEAVNIGLLGFAISRFITYRHLIADMLTRSDPSDVLDIRDLGSSRVPDRHLSKSAASLDEVITNRSSSRPGQWEHEPAADEQTVAKPFVHTR